MGFISSDEEDIRNIIKKTLDTLFQEDPQRGGEATVDVAKTLIDNAGEEALKEGLKSLEPYMYELVDNNNSGSEIHIAM